MSKKSFWERYATLRYSTISPQTEAHRSSQGTVDDMYREWQSLPLDEQASATLHISGETELDAEGINALAEREDFPLA